MNESTTIIGKSSAMSLALVIMLVGGAFWHATKLATIENKLDNLSSSLQQTASRQRVELWVERLRTQNPTLHVPDYPKQ